MSENWKDAFEKGRKQTVCVACGRPYRPLPAKIIARVLNQERVSVENLTMCPRCRRKKVAEAIKLKS